MNKKELIEKIIEYNGISIGVKTEYIFSPSQYPFTGDFEDVAGIVEQCALHETIYNVYKAILPKKKVKENYENNEGE